jgi:hypothetical protein
MPRHHADRSRLPLRRLAAGLTLAALLVAPARAAITFVDDFDDGADPLSIGAASSVSVFGTNIATAYKTNLSSEPAVGNRGGSLKLTYTTGSDSGVLLNFGSNLDISSYTSVSFWVRGAAGSERFQISLKRATATNEPTFRPDIRNFLPAGITTSWQKVVIPLRALMAEFMVTSSTALSDVNAIVFTTTATVPTESFYIDDVLIHTSAGRVWVENYDDGAEPGPYGYNAGTYLSGGSGASLTATYDASASSSAPFGLKIAWNTGTAVPNDAAAQIQLDSNRNSSVAQNITGADRLFFRMKAGSDDQRVGVGLSDDNFTEKLLAFYPEDTGWNQYDLSVSVFGLASSTNIAQVQFWLANNVASRELNGTTFANQTSQNIFVDDVRFEDTISPSAPSGITDDQSAANDGHFFGASNAVAFNAPSSGSDSTLESVRFEHDGLTGGTTWYTVYRATDTSASSHRFTWNTTGLTAGSEYRVRAVSMDLAGNLASLHYHTIEIDPATDASSPVVTHTAVTSTASGSALPISVSVTDDKRVAGVALRYRKRGETAFTSISYDVPVPRKTSFTGSVSIPAAAVTAAGLEYYIEASDFANNAFFASAASPQAVVVSDEEMEDEIGAGGGTVVLDDGNSADGATSVVIPAGALDSAADVTIALKDAADVPDGAAAGRTRPFAAYEFGPSGLTFRKPVRVTLRYPDADQDGLVEDADGTETSFAETDVRVFTHDGFAWRDLGGEVDATRNVVSANAAHFSTFAVFPGGAATKDKIRPPQKIITPEGSPGVNDTLDFGGAAAGARIEIYDVRGRLVRRLEERTSWDGRDADGSIVEGGVYLYHAEVEGITVSGTVTVAR